MDMRLIPLHLHVYVWKRRVSRTENNEKQVTTQVNKTNRDIPLLCNTNTSIKYKLVYFPHIVLPKYQQLHGSSPPQTHIGKSDRQNAAGIPGKAALARARRATLFHVTLTRVNGNASSRGLLRRSIVERANRNSRRRRTRHGKRHNFHAVLPFTGKGVAGCGGEANL